MGNRRNMKKSQASYARECLYLACQGVGAYMQMKREAVRGSYCQRGYAENFSKCEGKRKASIGCCRC